MQLRGLAGAGNRGRCRSIERIFRRQRFRSDLVEVLAVGAQQIGLAFAQYRPAFGLYTRADAYAQFLAHDLPMPLVRPPQFNGLRASIGKEVSGPVRAFGYDIADEDRSEERRVGKECRSR